jgi:hypothetical protein
MKERQKLMTYYDDSVLQKERIGEHLILSDFIKPCKKNVIELVKYKHDWISLESYLYKINGKYLFYIYNHGSCRGCSTSIENRIYQKCRENDLPDDSTNEKKYAKIVIEEIIDDMQIFDTIEEIIKYYKSVLSSCLIKFLKLINLLEKA